MTEKPVVDIPVVSVSQITVGADPAEGAEVMLKTTADADVRLVLSTVALAQLEALRQVAALAGPVSADVLGGTAHDR